MKIEAINAAIIAGKTNDEIRQLVKELHTARTADRGGAPMTAKQKAADLRQDHAASKKVRAGQLNNTARQHPATFIRIDDEYAIGADSHSWRILQKRRYKSADRWEPIAWYVSLEQCVNGLADRAVCTCGAQSLAELLI